MQKTFSQKVARVFEIIDYFLLIPAAIGVLVAVVITFGGSVYGLLILAALIVGLALQVGYFKHSRGRLDENHISLLWLSSAIFNFLLFLPWLYGASVMLQNGGLKNYEGETDGGRVFYYLFLVGINLSYIAAIVFSVKAYSFEKRKKYL